MAPPYGSGRSFHSGMLVTLAAALAMAGGVAFFKLRGGASPDPAVAVRLEQPTIDLGVAVPRAEINGAFVVRNRGSQAVTVGKVSTDCGCFVPDDVAGAEIGPGGARSLPFRFRASVQGKFERNILIEITCGPARSVVRGAVRGVSLPERGWYVETGNPPELGILVPGETRKLTCRLAGRPEILQELAFQTDSPQMTVHKGKLSEPDDLAGLHRLAVEIVVTGASTGSPGGTVSILEGGKSRGRIAVRWDSVTNDRKVRAKRFLGVIPSGSEQEIALTEAGPEIRVIRGEGVEIVRIAGRESPVVVVRFPKDKAGLHKAEIEFARGDASSQILELTASLAGAGSGS